MKGAATSGEVKAVSHISGIEIERIGDNFLRSSPPQPEAVATSLKPGMEKARQALADDYQLVILDELVTAVTMGVVSEDEVLALIDLPGRRAELILTGRGASERLIDAADLVTEMRLVKHPYDQGIPARRGIEF